jgi:hypothetical protein
MCVVDFDAQGRVWTSNSNGHRVASSRLSGSL